MNLNPDSLCDLMAEAIKIDEFLNITASEDINECAERGSDLCVYIARTGKMLADAKYWQDIAINSNTLLIKQAYPSMEPSIAKKLIESMSNKENYLVTWIDRLNRAATHQLAFMVTLISKAKEEMKLLPKI